MRSAVAPCPSNQISTPHGSGLVPEPPSLPKIDMSASIIFRTLYALCLVGATCTHVALHLQQGILLAGLEPYGFSKATLLFWSSLTLLDPLAVLLLFLRPRVGLSLAAAIIIVDVAHNSWILYRFNQTAGFTYWSQVSFLVFLLATLPFAWRGLPQSVSASSGQK